MSEVEPRLLKTRSQLSTFESPALWEDLASELRTFYRKFQCAAIGIVERDIASKEGKRVPIAFLDGCIDAEDLVRVLEERAGKTRSSPTLQASAEEIPVFTSADHWLVALSPGQPEASFFEEHFELLRLRIRNLFEHYQVTHEILNLYGSINAEDLGRLYAHSQMTTFVILEIELDCWKTSLKEKNFHDPEFMRRLAEAVRTGKNNLVGLRGALRRDHRNVSISEMVKDLRAFAVLVGIGDFVRFEVEDSLEEQPVPGIAQMILTTLLKNSHEALIGIRDVKPNMTLRVFLSENGRFVTFLHTDNGVGMTEEMKVRLFVPFASSKSHKRGLGLYLSQRLARELNGSLELAYSEPDKGTGFMLRLPLA